MIASSPDGVVIDVQVIPRAAKAGVAGTRENAVLVRLHAPPVDGAANAELVDILSHALGVPRRAIAIAAGERTRRKRVAVAGITADEARRRLAP